MLVHICILLNIPQKNKTAYYIEYPCCTLALVGCIKVDRNEWLVVAYFSSRSFFFFRLKKFFLANLSEYIIDATNVPELFRLVSSIVQKKEAIVFYSTVNLVYLNQRIVL
jgi:hypothetical protein